MLPFERRWALEIFDTILPSGADQRLPLGAADLPLEHLIKDVCVRAPGRFALGFRVAVWLVIWSPLFVLKRVKRFTKLSATDRLAHIQRLGCSDRYLIREAVTLLKMIACLGYGGLPVVQRQVGYDRVDAALPVWAQPEEAQDD